MYLSFYNLKKKPFQITVDPEFIWLGEKHKEALATLKYGILDNKGFLLLTGEVGVGKTLLINYLVDLVQVETIVTTIPDPDLNSLDFFHFLADGFGMNNDFTTKTEFLISLRSFLYASYSSNQKVLLIIDEAQRLSRDRLEEIRLLSNIELNHSKLINIFFVGQSEFNDILAKKECRAVRQRIALNYNIEPLDKNETLAFIMHRLKVAGANQLLFTNVAIDEIYAFSKGIPRLINILCDHALLTGYARGAKKIDLEIVQESARDLEIPTSPQQAVVEAPAAIPDTALPPANHKPENREPEKEPPHPTAVSPPPVDPFSSMKSLMIGVMFILLGAMGYFLYLNINSAKAPKWSADQLTPKKFQETLQQEKENLAEKISGMETQETKTPPAVKDGEPSQTGKQTPPPTAVLVDTASPPMEDLQAIPTGDNAIDPQEIVTISFATDSNDIPPSAIPVLDIIGSFLLINPGYRVEIRGYTDNTGSRIYNENVSRFRASAIKSYLIGKGAEPDSMTSLGLGPVDYIAPNDTLEGRQQNRRVEIEFFPNKPS